MPTSPHGHDLELLFATPQDRDKLVQVARHNWRSRTRKPGPAHASPPALTPNRSRWFSVPDRSRFFRPTVSGGRNLDPSVPGENRGHAIPWSTATQAPKPGATFDLKFATARRA